MASVPCFTHHIIVTKRCPGRPGPAPRAHLRPAPPSPSSPKKRPATQHIRCGRVVCHGVPQEASRGVQGVQHRVPLPLLRHSGARTALIIPSSGAESFGWFPGPPRSLKTLAQYTSNNHLTGGSAESFHAHRTLVTMGHPCHEHCPGFYLRGGSKGGWVGGAVGGTPPPPLRRP